MIDVGFVDTKSHDIVPLPSSPLPPAAGPMPANQQTGKPPSGRNTDEGAQATANRHLGKGSRDRKTSTGTRDASASRAQVSFFFLY
jgi:hypothetical protein